MGVRRAAARKKIGLERRNTMKTGCVAFLPERRYRWSMSVLLLLAWATAASAAIVDVEIVSDRKGPLPLYRAGSAGGGDTYRA